MIAGNDFVMGFDFSTQQLKVIVIDGNLNWVFEDSVKFDDMIPYRTKGGCHVGADGMAVTAPTIMWVEALDKILDSMKTQGFEFGRVKAISGAGQQHGSVYWGVGAASRLANLLPEQSLASQLADVFSVPDSPIWMDSSTSAECKMLEDSVGGAKNLADLTGSRAYERFTGNQILKIVRNNPQSYKRTERISLVSSFGASLFLGQYANIDESDGSGMNLMNIYSREWEEPIVKCINEDLTSKLGLVVPSTTVLGTISSYFIHKYDFKPDCQVVAFTGDNPASLAGMRLADNDIAISLGTSDTVFLWLLQPVPQLEGHVLVNPVDFNAYMALLCFKNGSLTREAIRDSYSDSDWNRFSSILGSTPIGNQGNIGMYFDSMEIIPNIQGHFYFNEFDEQISSFDHRTHVRAVIEGQFLSRRVHAENLGFKLGGSCRILATGGASNNQAILQVMSDVFNAPVYTQEVPNAAALGAAYLALHAVNHLADGLSFQERLKNAMPFKLAAEPNSTAKEIYDAMSARYRKLEASIIKLQE